MYKNPISNDNSLQKTIKSHPDIIFFQNSLKYSKYASIPPQYFSKKNHPPPSCFTFQLLRFSGKLLGDRLCIVAES